MVFMIKEGVVIYILLPREIYYWINFLGVIYIDGLMNEWMGKWMKQKINRWRQCEHSNIFIYSI